MNIDRCDLKLRKWKESDFSTLGSRKADITLEKDGIQIGAAVLSRDNILKDILVNPQGKGYGQKFIMLLMKRAMCLGKTELIVENVLGHGSTIEEQRQNYEKMLHILSKLGFKEFDKDTKTWKILFTRTSRMYDPRAL